MADRYDDYGRGSQGRKGEGRDYREGQDRGEAGREENDYRNQSRGNWQGEQERSGNRGDWSRERHEDQPFGQRGEFGGGQRQEYGSQRSDYGGQRGDFGQGEYGGRHNPSGQRDDEWQRQRGSDWQRTRNDWSSERGGQEGRWNTGSQGSGMGGNRPNEFGGNYTGYGNSGSQSYSGGAGTYGPQEQRGRFTGKGPKGYQRSDDRIREDVCEQLTHHADIDATEIEVKVSNGEVTLTGTVDERQAKRMSEDVAENVSGVKEVHNQLRVREREMAGLRQQTGNSGTSTASSGSSLLGTSGKEQSGSQRK